jgi:3-hydroxymyristoyl/3-hydroxydecanoyl-(acyl carrier protein) dehydratase
VQEPKDSPVCGSVTIRRNINVDKGLPVFKGHFPGAPVVPAAMLLEWMLETLPGGNDADASWIVKQAKFVKTVEPGMNLSIAAIPVGDSFTVSVSSEAVTCATAKFRRAR